MRYILRNFGNIVLAIGLAFLVWITAVAEQDPPREDDYDQSIPIQIIGPAENLVNINILPDDVKLRLRAPESSWRNLSPSKFKAVADLSKLETGTFDVPVDVTVLDNQVRIIDQTPQELNVNLEAVKTISMSVQVEIQDSPPLGYISRTPQVEPATVMVSGPTSLIAQVERAVAGVFLRNSKESIDNIVEVRVQDQVDNPVRGVQIEPEAVQVTVPIDQRFGYKDVSVRVSVQGQPASGYRISNIKVDPPTLTIVGNPGVLGEIAGLIETVPINLDQITESIVRTVPLNLPDGVTTVVSEHDTDGPEGVQVTVEIAPIENAITLQRPITQQGIDPDFWWRASPDRADVFLSGPLPLLQTLEARDVEIIVDLFGLEPGVHVLQPGVFKPDGVRLDAIVPDTIEVTIGRIIPRVVIPQGLNNDFTANIAPRLVDLQLLGTPERMRRLNPANVTVTLDLEDVGPGLYRLEPTISVPDGITVDSVSPAVVNVTVDLKPGITLTPTLTATATVTPTAQ